MSTNDSERESVDNLLITIHQIKQRQHELDWQLKTMVKALREGGATWRMIGEALGVSAQNVWVKYRPAEAQKIKPGQGAYHVDEKD